MNRGPFCVIVRRSGSWWRVTGLYQGRGWRIARSSAGSFRERSDALTSLKVILK